MPPDEPDSVSFSAPVLSPEVVPESESDGDSLAVSEPLSELELSSEEPLSDESLLSELSESSLSSESSELPPFTLNSSS